MEKLLELINEYEESRWDTVDDGLTEEERESWAIIEETHMWSEYEWHLRHCNANKVAYEKDTFDAYALSKKYGFIRRLVKNWHTTLEYWNWFKNTVSEKTLITVCAISDDPIKTLMNYLS